jgi:hypothetical protein
MQTPVPRALAPRTASVTYPGTTEQIRAVRADLRGLLGDCPIADDVILCASELAANAAIHSRHCAGRRAVSLCIACAARECALLRLTVGRTCLGDVIVPC